MKKKKIIKWLIATIIILILPLSQTITYAHSGKTDSSGGHKDKNNVSGLGGYHYHCGGHPAHLHTGGVCPYSSSNSSSSSSSKLNSQSTSTKSSKSSASTKSPSNTSDTTAQKTTSTESSIPKNIEVTSIQIQNKDKKMLITGDSLKLTATIEPSNATDSKMTWNSSDTSIAVINENGDVEAIQEGTAVITVKSSNGKEDSIELNIKNPDIKITNIILEETEMSINTGDIVQLNATIEPDNATNKSVEWTSSDESIVKVEEGKIIAMSEGVADVIVTSENGIRAICRINVSNPVKSEISVQSSNSPQINSSKPQINSSKSSGAAVGTLALIGGSTAIALSTKKKKKSKH